MEMALEHYGIEISKVNATTLRGKCPLSTHVGESDNSFSVNTTKNAWACHAGSCVANRDNRAGGNVLDFVAFMEDCTIRDAALMLQNWFNIEVSNERPPDYVPSRERKDKNQLAAERKQGSDDAASDDAGVETDEGEPMNEPLEFELKSIDSSHDYFRQRGIREATAEHFGVGYFHGKGSMAGRVVIPIHNETGDLIAYAGRSIDDEEPKYKVPPGFQKSLVLFNLHRVLEMEMRVVIVVEGFFDSFKIHQAGFPNAVAIMGSQLSEFQEKILIEHFDRVIIIGDGDKSGREFIGDATERLSQKLVVRPVCLPDEKQPDRLSSEQIQEFLSFL